VANNFQFLAISIFWLHWVLESSQLFLIDDFRFDGLNFDKTHGFTFK
jgi:hypothetical protein